MSAKRARVFSREFKEAAVRRILAGEKVKALAVELGLWPKLLYAWRESTVLATAFDLKVFFSVIATDPAAVTTADVLAFIASQRAPRRGATVVRIEDGEPGLSARTIKRRLATIAGLYEYLIIRGDTGVTVTRCPAGWRCAGPVNGPPEPCPSSAPRARCRA